MPNRDLPKVNVNFLDKQVAVLTQKFEDFETNIANRFTSLEKKIDGLITAVGNIDGKYVSVEKGKDLEQRLNKLYGGVWTVVSLIVLGVLGILLSHAIPGFKLGG